MPRYVYTVWFRDALAEANDEDREWPACFVIEASSAHDAQAWGNHLSQQLSARRESEIFLRSEIEERTAEAKDRLPVVPVGHEASDAEIGW